MFLSDLRKRTLANLPYTIIAAITSVLAIVTAIVYVIGYNDSKYMSWLAFAVLLVGAVLFFAAYCFSVTQKYAPMILWGFCLVALFAFISDVYMYLTEVFYNGKLSAENFSNLSSVFVCCLILFLLCAILSNVCMWMCKEKANAKEEIADER